MMTNRFEDLWNSADDGASSPVSPLELHNEAEFDGLLDAWFLERRNSIEFEILLDESRKLIRRLLAEVEANAKLLRDRQGVVEIELLAVPASSWPEAAAKARYVLNLYAAELATADTHHRDLVAAVLADFARLSGES